MYKIIYHDNQKKRETIKFSQSIDFSKNLKYSLILGEPLLDLNKDRNFEINPIDIDEDFKTKNELFYEVQYLGQ